MGDQVTCQICNSEPSVGVAAVPGIPVSLAYGQRCLAEGADPWGLVLTNLLLAVIPDPDQLPDDEDQELVIAREAVARGEVAQWALDRRTYHDGEYKTVREALGL